MHAETHEEKVARRAAEDARRLEYRARIAAALADLEREERAWRTARAVAVATARDTAEYVRLTAPAEARYHDALAAYRTVVARDTLARREA